MGEVKGPRVKTACQSWRETVSEMVVVVTVAMAIVALLPTHLSELLKMLIPPIFQKRASKVLWPLSRSLSMCPQRTDHSSAF
jgi:hypothetical protein